MFAFLKRKFQAKQKSIEKEPEITIAKGQLWIFVPPEDPFEPKKYVPVKILDVRDGWVRYDIVGNLNIFRDERHPIKTFMSMYRRVDN